MPESGFTQVMKFRQGATFKKVDLHNHTPASQCSSYRLPPELHAIFDIQGRRFFDDFTRIQKKLKEVSVLKARDVAVLKAEREKLKRRLLVEDQAFAGSTRNVPRRLRSPKTRDHARKCDAEKEAFRRKSERFVKSFYFPLEYVLRCLIEGMEVTALTDHNHPGYIMPERPELGTWYDRIVQENTRLLKSRAKGARGERKVRKLITDRLTTALAHLSDRKPSLVKGEPPDSKHRDKGRKTRKKRERMEHITECLNYFQQGGSIRRLDILQGAEITVSDIHILAIFPHQFYTPITIASLLKNVGIHEDQWGDGFVAAGEMSPQEVIDRIDESGGIAIPAHSNSSFKGLFMLFKKGLALSKVLQHKSLYAAEYIEGKINPLLGTRAQFESRMSKSRTYRKHGLTFVRGSDAHECRIECDGTGEDIGWRRYSYIKMDIRPNDTSNDVFNSLKIALKNGFNRVVEMPPDDIYYPFGMVRKMKKKKIPLLGKEERASVLRTQERLTITGVLVKGGYADGVSLRFNPYLNCIVGKTGKSTILRLAGYPLNICGFMAETQEWWFPQQIMVYFTKSGRHYCMIKEQISLDKKDERSALLEREGKRWKKVQSWVSDAALPNFITEGTGCFLAHEFKGNEDNKVKAIAGLLCAQGTGPLLINQPGDIFNQKELYESAVGKAFFRNRQILWTTGSANIATCLDPGKVIIVEEMVPKRKEAKPKLLARIGGDLHNKEIRDKIIDLFEGGERAFITRHWQYDM